MAARGRHPQSRRDAARRPAAGSKRVHTGERGRPRPTDQKADKKPSSAGRPGVRNADGKPSNAGRLRARRVDDDSSARPATRSFTRPADGATTRPSDQPLARPSALPSDLPAARRLRASSHEGERLQKVLARLGVASRREAEEWIKAGRITVNGEKAILGSRVSRSEHIRLDGRLIHRHEIAAGQVYLCHRSPGEHLRTPAEPSEHQALLERLPRRAGNRFITISPMPRIDGGLEIVTSDGELAATLQRSVHRQPSEFSVRVRGELTEVQLKGVLDGTLDRGDRLQVESCEAGGGEAANRWYTLIARGGSGKDVRQLFERQGALVSRVLRTRIGSLELDRRLSRGQFRPLTADEIENLRSPQSPGGSEPGP